MRLKGDEIGACGGEGEGDRLGGRGLSGAVELDDDLRRFLQRIGLQVVDDVRRQRGSRSLVRREAYRDVLGACLLDDDRHEQTSAGFLDRGCADAAAIADGDFRRLRVGGLEMEERDRGRLGLGVGSAGEAIAMQLERSFAILGLKL